MKLTTNKLDLRSKTASLTVAALILCALYSQGVFALHLKDGNTHKLNESAYDQINDLALKEFLSDSFAHDTQKNKAFDKYDAEVWLERSLNAMQRFKVEKQEALTILQSVYVESKENQLPPDLVLAVIEIESHFQRFAVSRVGAQGLMQVMPFWKDEMGRPHDNLTEIETNIRYGCKILAYYLSIAKQNWSEALARYNGSYGRTVYSEKVLTVWGERWRNSSAY